MNESCITIYKCKYKHYNEIGGELNLANISCVTRRDIFDLFRDGIKEESLWINENIYYPYYGRFEILDFLKRLYDLKEIKSKDSRFDNAEDEIAMHTRNRDYSECWVFNDERFLLYEGDDTFLLNFLCEVFHPEVRDEKKDWKMLLDKINDLLREDGYELFVSNKLSGREVFDWKFYEKGNDMFIPYSKRTNGNNLDIKLPNQSRYQLFKVMDKYDEDIYLTTETNFNYTQSIKELVYQDIVQFYQPKHYVDNNLVKINEFNEFKQGTSPFVIFDVIESFSNHTINYEKFETEINEILKLNGIAVELKNRRIISLDLAILDETAKVDEMGLNKLVEAANNLYKDHKYSLAVEKIWDAYERMKTYYSPELDKKKSANKIIKKLSAGNDAYKALFDKEFMELNSFGNDHCIRHHEKNKIVIENDLQYKYFYLRCYALVSVVMDLLK